MLAPHWTESPPPRKGSSDASFQGPSSCTSRDLVSSDNLRFFFFSFLWPMMQFHCTPVISINKYNTLQLPRLSLQTGFGVYLLEDTRAGCSGNISELQIIVWNRSNGNHTREERTWESRKWKWKTWTPLSWRRARRRRRPLFATSMRDCSSRAWPR